MLSLAVLAATGVMGVSVAFAADAQVSLASVPVSDTVVGGEGDVELIGFVVSPPVNEDSTITQVTLTAYMDANGDGNYVQGEENGIAVQNVVTSVWVEDEDGNVVMGPEAVSAFGTVTFNDNVYIESGMATMLSLKGDVSVAAPYGGYDANYVAFNIVDVTTDFLMEDENGNSVNMLGNDEPNGDINGGIAPTVKTTVIDHGDLVIEDAGVLNDRIVAASGSDVYVGSFSFTATEENFEVNELTVTFTDWSLDFASAPSVTDAIDTVTITYPTDYNNPNIIDGSATAVISGGTNAYFTGLDFAVPEDDEVILLVYVDLAEHTNDGGTLDSGDDLHVALNNVNPYFTAIGMTSGVDYEDVDLGVVADNTVYVYRSVPVVAHAMLMNGSLVLGDDVEFYRFTVYADSNGNIQLSSMGFDFLTTGLDLDLSQQWFIKDYDTGDVVGRIRYLPGRDALVARFFQGQGQVQAGVMRTFSLHGYLDDADPLVADESLMVRVHEDTSDAGVGTVLDIKNYFSGFAGMIWSDGGNVGGHGLFQPEWMGGYKVVGFPMNYVSLS